MKTLRSAVIIAILTLISFSALAKSTVKQSIIINQSVNANNKTHKNGYDNVATSQAIFIKEARIIKSVIMSGSNNKTNVTIAYGEGNTGATGLMIFE